MNNMEQMQDFIKGLKSQTYECNFLFRYVLQDVKIGETLVFLYIGRYQLILGVHYAF